MSGQPEDPGIPDPAHRLQAALDRIAQSAEVWATEARAMEERAMEARDTAPPPIDPALLQRLDSLILQLRDALDE